MIKGLTFDFPFFSVLQQCMLKLLQEQYNDLKLGSLTLIVNSLHIYESDFLLTRKMIINNFSNAKLPLIEHKLIDKDGNFHHTTSSMFCNWMDNILNGGMKIEH